MGDSASQDLLNHHYKTLSKLDYFILSIDVALLGWTIVNTGWIPRQNLYIWLMVAFWSLIVLSIVCGIIRQLYNASAFGINYQALNATELASQIERATLNGGNFINQQTGKIIENEKFKQYGVKQRELEDKGKKLYGNLSGRSRFFGSASIILLVSALFLLAIIKILSFNIF